MAKTLEPEILREPELAMGSFRAAIKSLSLQERLLLTHYYVLEESPQEICKTLGLSEDEFEVLRDKAISHLKDSNPQADVRTIGQASGKTTLKPAISKTPAKRNPKVRFRSFDVIDNAPEGQVSVTARILPVVAHAVGVFGDEHKASHWLTTPLPLLEGRSPSEVLEQSGGVAIVERILTRIEHNIPS